MRIILPLTIIANIIVGRVTTTDALSPQVNKNHLNRKDFLGKLATASSLIIGTSTVVDGLGVNPASNAAFAATTDSQNSYHLDIYTPPPNSQIGKVHIITGASTGLGLESAKRIAAAGATVILTSRTTTKGEKAVQQVQEYLKSKSIRNSEIYYLQLDLDDFESIQSFPERYNQLTSNKKIDVLMNNAGVAAIPQREVTKDGFERTFQSNHLVSIVGYDVIRAASLYLSPVSGVLTKLCC